MAPLRIDLAGKSENTIYGKSQILIYGDRDLPVYVKTIKSDIFYLSIKK